MNIRKTRMAALAMAICMSGTAQAALQGRDLNGSIDSFEAYYDTVLDITWLADANYAKTSGYDTDGLMTRTAATNWAASLSFSDGTYIYDDWRLPLVKPVNGTSFNYSHSTDGSTDYGYNITSPNSEMAYMFYVNLGNSGNYSTTGTLNDCWSSGSDRCLQNLGPFINLQPDMYWSGTLYAPNTSYSWRFNMAIGWQTTSGWYNPGVYAWAVSTGDVGIAAIPEPETYAMLLAGLGLVGVAAKRRRRPSAGAGPEIVTNKMEQHAPTTHPHKGTE